MLLIGPHGSEGANSSKRWLKDISEIKLAVSLEPCVGYPRA
jgi:hypothetical protein